MNKIIENKKTTGTFGHFRSENSGTFRIELDGLPTGQNFGSMEQAKKMLARCENQAEAEGYRTVRSWYESHI